MLLVIGNLCHYRKCLNSRVYHFNLQLMILILNRSASLGLSYTWAGLTQMAFLHFLINIQKYLYNYHIPRDISSSFFVMSLCSEFSYHFSCCRLILQLEPLTILPQKFCWRKDMEWNVIGQCIRLGYLFQLCISCCTFNWDIVNTVPGGPLGLLCTKCLWDIHPFIQMTPCQLVER